MSQLHVPIKYKETPDSGTIFQFGNVLVIRWRNEKDFPIEYITPNCKSVLGYDPEDFTSGRVNYMDIVYKYDRSRLLGEVRSACDTQKSTFEHQYYRLVHKKGNILWVKDNTSIIYDDQKNITHFLGYVVDMTEPFHDKEMLNLSLLWSNIGYWDWHYESGIYYSSSWYKLLGYDDNEFQPSMDVFYSMIHPEDKLRVKKEINECLNLLPEDPKCNFNDIEFRIRCKDGQYKWILSRGNIVEFGEELKPTRMAGIHVDITEKKKYIKSLELYNQILILCNRHTTNLIHHSPNWEMLFNVVKDFGELLDVDRVFVFEKSKEPVDGDYIFSQLCQWEKPDLPEEYRVSYQTLSAKNISKLCDLINGEDLVNCGSCKIDNTDCEIVNRNAKSTILFPIKTVFHQKDLFWGFIGFDSCVKSRNWDHIEVEAFNTLANLITLIVTEILQIEEHHEELNFFKEQLNIIKNEQFDNLMALKDLKADLDSTTLIPKLKVAQG